MPYKSEKQKAWMHINKPKVAKKWDKKYGKKVTKRKKDKKQCQKKQNPSCRGIELKVGSK